MDRSDTYFVEVPPLKGEFLELLNAHNVTAMEVFSSYIIFCTQRNSHHKEQTFLPGSTADLFSHEEALPSLLDDIQIPFTSRSSFSALNGRGDVYEDLQDMLTGARSSVEVGSSFVPLISHEDVS
jgi:hypothetical protein